MRPMQMVVQRELLVTARARGSYWARVFAGAFATVALVFNTGAAPDGRRLFFTAVVLAFAACIFEGVRRASAAIATEKKEGTLELLFLTALTGPELVRGKFAAIAISAYQAGLAAVPVLAASLLLGGVSAGEFARSILALAHALSLVIAVTLRASARSRDGDSAMIGIIILLSVSAAILAGLGWAVPMLRPINPMAPLILIPDFHYAFAPHAFWISLTLGQIFVWFSLQTLGERLPSLVQQHHEESFLTPAPVRIEDWKYTPGEVMPTVLNDAPRWFRNDPIEWLTITDMGMHEGRWGVLVISLLAGAAGMISAVMGGTFAILALGILAVCLCNASARSLARFKQSGWLELLLTTPLGDRGILEGHRKGLSKVFFWPFVIWIVVLANALFNEWNNLLAAYTLAGVILMAWMVPWFAVAAALKAKTPHRAVGWTIFFVLVLPRLFFCWLGDVLYFGIAGFLVRDYVKNNFRRLVAERFQT